MSPMPRPAPLCTALLCLATAAAAQVTPVGPPTFDVEASLDLEPGDRPPIRAYIASPAWKSSGRTGSSGGRTAGPFIGFPPSEAQGESSDRELGVLAYTGGTVQFSPTTTPHLHAIATASNTRYWQTGAVDTPLDFTPILDGFLQGQMVFAELPFLVFAKVSFALDVVDLAGNPTQHLFRNTAHVDWNASAGRWTFTTTATTPGTAWADSFTTVNSVPLRTIRSDLVYAQFLEDAYVATAGSLFGLRWTLQTEALIEGIAVQAAVTADFLHTAGLGFAVSPDAPAGAALTEVLVLAPAVPEPASALLLALGLLPLLRRVRRRPG